MAATVGGSPMDRALLDPDGVFPGRLIADRAVLLALATGLQDAADYDERLRRMATLAHRLGGAAGTFGYHAISESALLLEDAILDRQPGDGPSTRQGGLRPDTVRRAAEALLVALDDGIPRT